MRKEGTRVMMLGQLQPPLRQQYMWPVPSHAQPQNLLRATLQNGPHAISGGLGDAMSLGSLGRVGRMLGQTPDSGPPPTDQLAPPAGSYNGNGGYMSYQPYALLATASMAASAYHGYARNESVPWALWWALMGAMFPIVTPAIGLAQGWGKRKRAR